MARKPNHINTSQITLSTTPRVIEELELLVLTGHYGKNPAEAAERVLAAELNRLFGEEALKIARDSGRGLRQAKARAARRN